MIRNGGATDGGCGHRRDERHSGDCDDWHVFHPGILLVVVRSRGHAEFLGANVALLVAGVASMVVAAVGLFVRASPTLSGFFLVVGASLLVLAVMVDTREARPASEQQEIDLSLLERSARAAESEIADGKVMSLHSLQEVMGSARDETPATNRAFISESAAKVLRRNSDEVSGALMQEMLALPMLEETSRVAPIEGIATGYRSVTLPSGHLAVYRRLTPVEAERATGAYPDEDAYLVADLVPLVPTHND
jgi:hypothetical protein